MHRHVLGMVCALILAASAAADVIHYKDGRTLEGVVVETTSTHLKVETAFGTIEVERSKVARVEAKLTPEQELEQRREAIPDDDSGALYQLALWAQEQGLRRDARKLFGHIIGVDPSHRGANEALGRVELDGRWFDPDDVEDELARIAEEREAQGLLLHEGEWLPAEQVMKARGFARYHDEWLPKREAGTRLALEALAELTADLAEPFAAEAHEGEYVTVFHALDDPETAELLVYDLDALVRDGLRRLPLADHEIEQITREHIPIYLLPQDGTATTLVERGFFDRYPMSDASREHFATVPRNFGLHWPRPFHALLEGSYLDVVGDRKLARTGILAHQVAETFIERLKGGRRLPGWVVHGFAAWYEGATNYYSTLSLTSDNLDEEGNPIDLWVDGWDSFPAWRDLLRQERQRATVRPLRDLFIKPRDGFDSKDVGVAWSFTRFLLERHGTQYLAYIRAYDAPVGQHTDDLRRLHERAWEQAFVDSVDDLDAAWRLWAGSQPQRFPADELGR